MGLCMSNIHSKSSLILSFCCCDRLTASLQAMATDSWVRTMNVYTVMYTVTHCYTYKEIVVLLPYLYIWSFN